MPNGKFSFILIPFDHQTKASIDKCFSPEVPGQKSWDWVINLAGETKYSQSEAVYDEKVRLLTVNCAKEAARLAVGIFIEVSTAQVYDADKVINPCGVAKLMILLSMTTGITESV